MVLTRTFDSTSTVTKASGTETVNGVERHDDSLDAFGLPTFDVARIVVTDVIEAIEDGRPRRLRRTFAVISEGYDIGPLEIPIVYPFSLCDLEGTTVIASWEDGEFRFEAAPDEEIEEVLLEHLAEDLDLRGFLPERPVAVGDTWNLGTPAYLSVFEFGGLLESRDEGIPNGWMRDHRYSRARRAGTDAEGEATFEGVCEEGDRLLAIISFEFEAQAEWELDRGDAEEAVGPQTPTRVRRIPQTHVRRRVMSGELRWDLDHGHLHSASVGTATEGVSHRRVGAVESATQFSESEKIVLTVERR